MLHMDIKMDLGLSARGYKKICVFLIKLSFTLFSLVDAQQRQVSSV